MYIHTCAYILHTYIHTYIHTYTHTYIHTHIQTCMQYGMNIRCVLASNTVTRMHLLQLLMVSDCRCTVDRSSEGEHKSSKKPRRRDADDDGINNLGSGDGDALSAAGAARDSGLTGRGRGALPGAGPSCRRAMVGCGAPEAVSTREWEMDAQGESSSCGQSNVQERLDRGESRERTPLEALLLPRTKRRKVDPSSTEKVDGCDMLPQPKAASRKDGGSGRRKQGQLDQ